MKRLTLAMTILAVCLVAVAVAPLEAQTGPAAGETPLAAGPGASRTLVLKGLGGLGGDYQRVLFTMGQIVVPPELAARAAREGTSESMLRTPDAVSHGHWPWDSKAVAAPLAEDVYVILSPGPDKRDALAVRLTLAQPGDAALLDAAAQRIVAAFVEQPPLPEEERAKRMKEVGEQIAALEDKMNLLEAMANNNETIGPEILRERIKTAELEKQRLELDLAALRVRRDAIAQQVERSKKDVDKALGGDEVLQQLREVVGIREEEAKRMEQLVQTGNTSVADAAAVREKLMSARIRVAEREEALRQGTKAGFLERLNDELATTMISEAEMEARLAMIREQQPSIDLGTIDEARLNRLTEQYRPLFRNPGTRPPLYFELEKKLNELRRQRLALQVTDVTVTPEQKAP